MAELEVVLSDIELKIRKLLNFNRQLVEENEKLVLENEELHKENEVLKSKESELHDRINKNIIVNALGNEKEIEEGRLLIKSLVKEIDECITILNNKQ